MKIIQDKVAFWRVVCAMLSLTLLILLGFFLIHPSQNLGGSAQRAFVDNVLNARDHSPSGRNPSVTLSEQEIAALFLKKYLAAAYGQNISPNESFYKLKSISVSVQITNNAKGLFSETQATARLESELIRLGVKVSPKSTAVLHLQVDGFWPKDGVLFVFCVRLSLIDDIIIGRDGDLRRIKASLWDEAINGTIGEEGLEKYLFGLTGNLAEMAAIQYLRYADR